MPKSHPGMFLRARNPKIIVRKTADEWKDLILTNLCVVAALFKMSFGATFPQNIRSNCGSQQEKLFGYLKSPKIELS